MWFRNELSSLAEVSLYFAVRVRTVLVASLSASWCSHYAGDNIDYEIEQFRLLYPLTSANWRLTPIHMLHTVAQYGGSGEQYWAPTPNSCTVKQLYLGNRSHQETCTVCCLEWAIPWPPRILTFPSGTACIYVYNNTVASSTCFDVDRQLQEAATRL